MVIELMDGTKLEDVKAVYGGPKLVDGIVRDVLRIEIEPKGKLGDVQKIFEDNTNTMKLYTYNITVNDDYSTSEEKVLMGEGYTIFVSAKEVEKTIPHPPGYLLPDTKETIYEIMIAQLTYEEYTGGE